MLGGLALKWRWRQKVGKGWEKRTPNLVMGSNVQVVWEKFCRYFDVEPRYLPMAEGRYVITPEQVLANVDEDSYTPDSSVKMGDHPVIWTNPDYAAKNLYIFMGHHPNLFENEAYKTLLRNAIFWAGTEAR